MSGQGGESVGHREYKTLLERDVRTAGAGVRPVTRWCQAEIEAYARAAGMDVVVELALADPAEARTVSALYRAAGYRIELVVLAVADADCQLGVLGFLRRRTCTCGPI